MISLLKTYRGFFIPYALFLLLGGFILLSMSRIQTHVFANTAVFESLNAFFTYLTHMGDGNFLAFVAVTLLFYKFRSALYLGFAGMLSGTITGLLKNFAFDDVNRPFYMYKYIYSELSLNMVLPPEDMNIHHSFPSGHATGAFCLFVGLMLLTRGKKWAGLFFVLALLTAYSRVYLSQHFFVDIYFGSLIGTISAMLVYVAFNRIQSNFNIVWWNKSLLKLK